ncbi:MAG TPA: DUF5615 family PIN-like protein [Anaerolineae bacterium]|nr:DUF5615 family PIN-like protein [Anaerolineae bacterium]
MAERIKFYVGEHVSRAVIHGLRRRGVDVLTVQEANLLSAQDAEHLALASAQGRVLFTQDADFLRLHAADLPHAGIVYAPQYMPVSDIIRGLMLIVEILKPDEIIGQVEYL